MRSGESAHRVVRREDDGLGVEDGDKILVGDRLVNDDLIDCMRGLAATALTRGHDDNAPYSSNQRSDITMKPFSPAVSDHEFSTRHRTGLPSLSRWTAVITLGKNPMSAIRLGLRSHQGD